MIEDVQAARAEALARIAAAASLDEVQALSSELLGKRSALAGFKQRLGTLDPEARRSVGQAVNESMAAVAAALDERKAALAAAARRARLEAERLDLTEVLAADVPPRG